ncbi:hypothetical protein O3P69_009810 [Scylla paramamosain]|uniref:Chitin-binding type-2 domain-containing protein n=1 Tax=Scylla paramamosain TaxID=85552 RepID=A0AAW0SNE3_SCYPA
MLWSLAAHDIAFTRRIYSCRQEATVKMARESSLVAVAVVLVGVLVGGASAVFPYGYYGTPSVLYHPYYSAPPISQPVTYTGLPMRPISLRAEEVMVLPCPGEGFFVHPTNSSRFYRCVDHTGTGRFFVRYIFECAPGFVFNPEPKVQTCMPGAGSVLGSTQPPTTGPSTDAPVPSTNPPVTPPSTDPPVPSVPPTDPPVPSVPPTDPPVTQPPVTDLPVPPTESTAPPTPDDSCKGQYVQHEMYCNVYRRCNDTSKRYMCPQGTAFSEQRQMCRIGAADEELCVGKIVAAVSSQLRTELVDGHILLPDDAVLVPLLTSPLTASHVAPHILTLRTPNVPQPHPYNFPSPGSSFAAIPLFHRS